MEIHNQNSRWIRRECVGKGSYGTVSVGVRESDGGVFAVKSAAKDCVFSMEALENEIEILRSLSSSSPSPFVVEYYGDDETRSHRNLHVEYVSGGDLASSGGVDDVDLIRSYTWCLVMALQSVHKQGIVHCDVKGSNVLLCPAGGVAKLADFGSAIRVNDHDHDRRSRIVPRGSPLWMAPEAVRGESQGMASDVWSLGCTVIEMFTGLPAWQDRGAHTLYKIGYSDELPEYPAGLPEVGEDFLNKCLERDVNRRWSCDQLLQHPFLLPAPASKIIEASPRSIFDWPDLDFSDDDHESEDEFDDISIRERINKLATTVGANWDSNGWVDVRGLKKLVDDDDDDEEQEELTQGEYSELVEGEEVISQQTACDYPLNLAGDDVISSSSPSTSGGGGGGGGRCGHGEDENEERRWRCGDGGGEIDYDYSTTCEVKREKLITAGLLLVDLFSFLLYFMYSSTRLGLNYRNKNKITTMINLFRCIFSLFFPWCFFHFSFIWVSDDAHQASSRLAVYLTNCFYFS